MTAVSLSETFGMFALPEIEALKIVVAGLPENPFAIVLGAGPGTATLAMLETRPDIIICSVDIVDPITEREQAKAHGFTTRLTQLRGHSVKVGESWDGPKLDLLFVDACHTYLCVKADNQAWLPHLREDGVVWYHDYGTENGMWVEVKTAVDEDMHGQQEIARVCCSIAFRWRPARIGG